MAAGGGGCVDRYDTTIHWSGEKYPLALLPWEKRIPVAELFERIDREENGTRTYAVNILNLAAHIGYVAPEWRPVEENARRAYGQMKKLFPAIRWWREQESPDVPIEGDFSKECVKLACDFNDPTRMLRLFVKFGRFIDIASMGRAFMAVIEGDAYWMIPQFVAAGMTPALIPSSLDPIACALQFRRPNALRSLIAHGFYDPRNQSPTELAVENGCTEELDILVENGADLYQETAEGLTLLQCAAQNGDKKMVEYLAYQLRNNLVLPHFLTEALPYAVESGNKELVVFMLKNGANLLAPDAEGNTVLHVVSATGDIEMARLLYAHDNNLIRLVECVSVEQEITPLWHAVVNGHTEMVRFLFRLGANPDISTKKGTSLLSFARGMAIAEIVTLIETEVAERRELLRGPPHIPDMEGKEE